MDTFHYKSEPGITPTPGICKQTSWEVCVDLSTYFVFIPMLSISDLIRCQIDRLIVLEHKLQLNPSS